MEPTGHVVKPFDSSASTTLCACEDLDLLQGKSVGLIGIITAKASVFYYVGMISIGILNSQQKEKQKDNNVIQLSDSLTLQLLRKSSSYEQQSSNFDLNVKTM